MTICEHCGQVIWRKLMPDDILAIRERRKQGESVKSIALDYGVGQSIVSRYTRDLSPKRRRRPN